MDGNSEAPSNSKTNATTTGLHKAREAGEIPAESDTEPLKYRVDRDAQVPMVLRKYSQEEGIKELCNNTTH